MPLMPYNRDSYDEGGTNSLFSRIDQCISEARSAVRVLPRVDAEGNSDCPFAQKLYDNADEPLSAAYEQVDQLHEHQTDSAAAMARAKEAEEQAIWNDDPRDDGSAERAEYELHRAAHSRIAAKIIEANASLREINEELESRRA